MRVNPLPPYQPGDIINESSSRFVFADNLVVGLELPLLVVSADSNIHESYSGKCEQRLVVEHRDRVGPAEAHWYSDWGKCRPGR